MLGQVIDVLKYLGITPEQSFPLLILGLVIIGVLHKFISPIQKSVTRITHACIEIQTVFGGQGVVLRHHLIETAGSPLQPTEYGKQLIIDSGLEWVLNKDKDFLKGELMKILAENPSEYDVQEKARELLITLKDHPIMSAVKKYAYDNGLDVALILKAGGLWLRDDFLGEKRRWTPASE